jgi:hypothetical protein
MHPNRTHLGLQTLDARQCVVIDGNMHGHYHLCTDQENGLARRMDIAWDRIVFIDYKPYVFSQHIKQDLARVLNNPQPIKILHIACNNDVPQYNQLVNMITHLKDITWRNQLCIEYFYHHAPTPHTVEQTIEQIRAVQPQGLLQADLFIDSMHLHVQLT